MFGEMVFENSQRNAQIKLFIVNTDIAYDILGFDETGPHNKNNIYNLYILMVMYSWEMH